MRLPSLKLFILLLIGCFGYVSAQYTIPKKPNILYPVYDEVGLLNESEKQLLNEKLIRFEDSTSTEIEVIIIPTTKGEDVNYVATMFGEKWGIGKEETDNGVVFLIASEDRTMSIQQGRNVEQYLTASVAGQILDYIVTPNFRQGLWYEGVNRGTSAIMEAVQGKFKPQTKKTDDSELGTADIMIIVFFLLLLFLIFYRNNNRGGGFYDDDDDDVIISRRGRRNYPGGFFPIPGNFGGGYSGGGFGGGFGGFGGGGSFGGGGASGGW